MALGIKVALIAAGVSMAFLIVFTLLAIAVSDALTRVGRKGKGGSDEAHNNPVHRGGSGSDNGDPASSEGESGAKSG